MDDFADELVKGIVDEVVEAAGEERNTEAFNQMMSGAVNVSQDEMARLKSGELKEEDLVITHGMTDAFVFEATDTYVLRARMELEAHAAMSEDPNKKLLWPHEMILQKSVDLGTINEFSRADVSFLVHYPVMKLSMLADSVRRNISMNRSIFLNAAENEFEIDMDSRRAMILTTISLEELYNDLVGVLQGAFDKTHEGVDLGRGEKEVGETDGAEE